MASDPKVKVVVADGVSDSRAVIRDLLRGLPFLEVIGEADTTDAAVSLVRHASPDLLLIDGAMDAMRGLEAAACAKRLRPSLKVLVYTAQPEEEYGRAALAKGADRWLAKLRLSRELPAAIQALIQLHP
ncbi:MAG: response regulator transcription factor [Armatimonadetes bacterium]|nr:response regulator transcription factor [Armatimonadota bacterium]